MTNVSEIKSNIFLDYRIFTSFSVMHQQTFRISLWCKYLGTVIDDKLTFEQHVDVVCKEAHQQWHSYRKLQGFIQMFSLTERHSAVSACVRP